MLMTAATFDPELKTTPRLEILRDIYQVMNRRLEHYRQLATGVIFGIVAIFILANNAIEHWKATKPAQLPATLLGKIDAMNELIVISFVVAIVVFVAILVVHRAN